MYAEATILAMRFDSKRDAWLVLLIRATPLIVLAIIVLATREVRGAAIAAVIIIVLELTVFESFLRSTYYTIDGDTLMIHSSLLRWRVPIREIRAITPTRSPLSSPALSLDRLRIDYGDKSIIVSPAERNRFIEALRAINPSIVA